MKKLEILGDSISKGVIFSAERNRYYLCDDKNYDSLQSENLSVKNRSKMGATVAHLTEIMPRVMDEIDDKSIVIFEFGGNDCDYDWQKISDNPKGDYLPHTPEKQYIEMYENAVNSAKKSGALVAVASLAPIDEIKYMKHISKGKSYENILSWLGCVETLSRWQEYYNSLTVELAKRLGCPIFDIRGAFKNTANYRLLISDDGIHPNEEGHRLIHKSMLKFINEI